jgi:pimeloyl-ACP methyl ester carboxylesterase
MTSLLLLHGLTFDHRQWAPLRRFLDPAVQVLAPDLPGHGSAPARPSYRSSDVVAELHRQVTAAGLEAPIVAGHSLGGVLATIYAARYPASAVVNVDQVLIPGPFGDLLRDAEPTLRSPAWHTVWDGLLAGMHIERLPAPMRDLVRSGSRPSAELLLGYWSELLEKTGDQIAKERAADLAMIGSRGIPYRFIASSEPPAPYRQWMASLLPSVRVDVLPGGTHFPHLADPEAVARLVLSAESDG